MTEAQLDRLSAHPSIARFIRALAAHPPVEIQAEGQVRRAAILLVLRGRADGEPEWRRLHSTVRDLKTVVSQAFACQPVSPPYHRDPNPNPNPNPNQHTNRPG